jgi:transcriptional regulator with XRE-family HTH domain
MRMAAQDRPARQTLSRLRPGAVIREARHFAGLTQAELAARLGTTQSAVSNWERGREVPRVDTLGRILQACGFEADLVFRRHDDEDRSQIVTHLGMTPSQRARHFQSAVEAFRHGRRARPVAQNA